MNIVVQTYSAHTVTRPDTSRDHNGEDLYVSEDINTLAYTPVLNCRICKSGKRIGEKFANRYYDALSFGILLYPRELLEDASAEAFASAGCLDHTSFLPLPSISPDKLEDGTLLISKDGEAILRSEYKAATLKQTIEETICNVSRRCLLRIGDFVCTELRQMETLCRREGKYEIRVDYGNLVLTDFNIIF